MLTYSGLLPHTGFDNNGLSTRFCVCSLIEAQSAPAFGATKSQYKILCMLTYSMYVEYGGKGVKVSVQDFVYAHL